MGQGQRSSGEGGGGTEDYVERVLIGHKAVSVTKRTAAHRRTWAAMSPNHKRMLAQAGAPKDC